MGLSSSLVVGAGSENIHFVTPFGTFAYQRLVMGYVNATAEFQRHMNNMLGPLLWHGGWLVHCFRDQGGTSGPCDLGADFAGSKAS